MRRYLWVLILLAVGIATWLTVDQASADTSTGNSSRSTVVCLPGVFMENPGNCQPVGPSAYLTNLAEQGITFPLTQLAAVKPDFGLTQVNTRYGLVRNANAPVYGSVDDAMTGKKQNAVQRIDSSFAYISYSEEAVVDNRRFYMIDYNQWMTANDVSRLGAVPLFQGVTLTQTPAKPFGWVLTYLSPGTLQTQHTPGSQFQDFTGRVLNNHELVQVYGEQKVGEETWYLLGPDEWMLSKYIARVIPNTKPPEGVTSNRWIEVNLAEQTLAVYDQGEMVFATLIASGLEPFFTRPGLFQIYQKLESTPMRGAFEADRSDAYYLEDVPWTMYYDDARALHGAYWRANLGYPQSHGCVNLSVGDAHWLFNWAQEGDWVYVWDPSGKTPTDPSFYKSGGY